MKAEEFDKIYDAEIERIFNSLPCPKTYPMPRIQCPVNLNKLNIINWIFKPTEFYAERNGQRIEHIIEFEKIFKNGKWAWVRL